MIATAAAGCKRMLGIPDVAAAEGLDSAHQINHSARNLTCSKEARHGGTPANGA
jgi:hypothetical protein